MRHAVVANSVRVDRLPDAPFRYTTLAVVPALGSVVILAYGVPATVKVSCADVEPMAGAPLRHHWLSWMTEPPDAAGPNFKPVKPDWESEPDPVFSVIEARFVPVQNAFTVQLVQLGPVPDANVPLAIICCVVPTLQVGGASVDGTLNAAVA